MKELDGLITEIARTWKEGGGNATDFSQCYGRVYHEIMLLEQTPLENYIGSLGSSPPASTKCFCYDCNYGKSDPVTGLPIVSTRMIVCPECGNKRCPRASNHRFGCTGSNEPGQTGSRF